jgi:aminotransferase in exopolysaccharide biosynthesis
MFGEITTFIRSVFGGGEELIPLHAPHFSHKDKEYVLDAIDSTYVSSVGRYVNMFEDLMGKITGAKYAVATVNGTCALHLVLVAAGVKPGDEVITQPLTFVATANAIKHAGATPVFVDVDLDTLGLSPEILEAFLRSNTVIREGICYNKLTGRRIAACVPMHTFGFPLWIDRVVGVCNQYGIPVIEDAAESLGSFYQGRHSGTFGLAGTFSFNGNKTVTCGGGGAVVTNDEQLAIKLKHLSTTAKAAHPWEFVHDEVAYNYRMPNLNAALACAQLEQLEEFIADKRALSQIYGQFFNRIGIGFVKEREGDRANYWLNAILFEDAAQKADFLEFSNAKKVMTRPIWRLMNQLQMYRNCQCTELKNAEWLADRVVNIPSSVRIK